MPVSVEEAKKLLTEGLNDEQRAAVESGARRLLVIAGAGSGKTEIMARRVAWWVAVEGREKSEIVAFTFTEAAADELKFRIRKWLQKIAADGEEISIGGMFIGTIHGFCLRALRDFAPDEFYMFDVLDEAGRSALVQQGANLVLGIPAFKDAAETAGAATGTYQSIDLFLSGYDLLNEHGSLEVQLASPQAPADVRDESDWCKAAALLTDVGASPLNQAFAVTAARYYAYLRARRFLDFSTVQAELLRHLNSSPQFAASFKQKWTRLVVDEVQDINSVQDQIISAIVGENGTLTAVGDHRQAIYAFRGGRIDIMGRLFAEFTAAPSDDVIELPTNYRSTNRIIQIANRWSNTIQDRAGMTNPAMSHGRTGRVDLDPNHTSLVKFTDRTTEAAWIAESIKSLVAADVSKGASHDTRDGNRGLTYSDVALLVRSGTDIRTYQDALRAQGIPAVVRAGPDLFSQPECLLALSALCISAGVAAFFGSPQNPRTMPGRIAAALNVVPDPKKVVPAAIGRLRTRGLTIPTGTEARVVRLAEAIAERLISDQPLKTKTSDLACKDAVAWLKPARKLRRVFPQTIFQWLMYEAGLPSWGDGGKESEVQSALFHIGQISKLVKSIETSGWTTPDGLRWQVIAIVQWGAQSARAEEAPLLATLDAVSITTVHSAKGLEFPAVFLADVNSLRFPSNQARKVPRVPFDVASRPEVNPALLADNANYDGERRLMYVALTRAERYLFVSHSGQRQSPFVQQLAPIVSAEGGTVATAPIDLSGHCTLIESKSERDERFSTSFSDIRYFLECPTDFYLRVVMGFTPTIGQEFGYGRGVHNLLRAVHASPKEWAELVKDPAKLAGKLTELQDSGLFYMRHTTGAPLSNLRDKAAKGVSTYIERYQGELSTLSFEPEKEFESLIPEENVLVSGAIDLVRLDDPPRVSIVDFKSGDTSGDNASGLSSGMMAFQIGVYGLAAKQELEYEPQTGLVRYIGEKDASKAETKVNLSDAQLAIVRGEIVAVAAKIRDRKFADGPSALRPDRCVSCDHLLACGRAEAKATRITKGMPF